MNRRTVCDNFDAAKKKALEILKRDGEEALEFYLVVADRDGIGSWSHSNAASLGNVFIKLLLDA